MGLQLYEVSIDLVLSIMVTPDARVASRFPLV